ncbi:MAG TPA: prepilin-type N-terminal cleavage/methylation domain-containing protein [Longimicrobiaceae bacterium]|nr:prepilin-type N-terminal cleavage/methylation domain-containing protein [Longimicrobiaceae bacterium]
MRFASIPGRETPRRGASESGFTLLEALVALAILGLALVPLLGVFSAGLGTHGRVEESLEAVALAEARMNELALVPPDSVARYLEPKNGTFPAPFERYRWRVLMRPLPDAPALLRAAVLVEWTGGEYALETVFYHPELRPDGVGRFRR